jgi:hypothetical protein
MSAVRDFFVSLKEDLLSKRLLPVLFVVGVALVGAVAYALLGGSSSKSTLAVSASSGSTVVAGVAVSQAPANPNQPISETTDGTSKQHGGSARDPFTPLPGSEKTASSSTASAKSSSSSSGSSTTSSSGSGTSSSSSGGTTPTTPKETTPAPPKKVYVHFHVTAQLGVVPPVAEGAPPQPAVLKTYKDMALAEPLPSKNNPQLVYLGVVLRTGKDVLFGLTGEAILHGSATCQPSPTQCQAIELQVGQSETLEFVEADGTPVTYELKLVSIDKSIGSASTARVHAAFRTQAKAARELARHVPKLSELRYSPWGGGLVIAGHPAFGRSSIARAHAARHHSR